MRRGFLPNASHQTVAQALTPNIVRSIEHDSSTARTSGQPSAGTPAVPTADQIEEILALLKGPADEKRFVGLLLATKLLQARDDDILRRVHEAVGVEFIDRLLLPLQLAVSDRVDVLPAGNEERAARQGAEVALGISVLAALCRLPEVAASEALATKAALFLQVARQGGVFAALQAQHTHSTPQQAAQQGGQEGEGQGPGGAPHIPVAEGTAPGGASPPPPAPLTPGLPSPAGTSTSATAISGSTAEVQDVLECVLATAQGGPEGRAAVVEAGAVGAVLEVLRRARPQHIAAGAAGRGREGQRRGGKGGEVVVGDAVRNSFLAVRLLGVVLGGSGRGQLMAAHESEVVPLVAELARMLALPATMKPRPQPAPTAAPANDLAVQLQLEALHVLHLLLLQAAAGAGSPGLRSALSASTQQEQSAAQRGGWPGAIRRGLGVVLRGRVSPVERHLALQLSAAMVDLAGTEWLLGGPCHAPGAAGTAGAGEAGAFYQVLVEVVRIETSVLLLDALAPAEPVPLAGSAARPAWRAGGSAGAGSEGEGEETLGEVAPEVLAELADMGEGAGGKGGQAGGGPEGEPQQGEQTGGAPPADVHILHQVLESKAEQRKLASSWRGGAGAEVDAEAVDGGVAPEGGVPPVAVQAPQRPSGGAAAATPRVRGAWESAGQRASRLLPACFALLEACIEALAISAQAEEEEEEEGAGDEAGAATLPPQVSLRAITSLQEVCDTLLQFLEETVGAEAGGEQAAGAAAGVAGGRASLQAAAVRVVGRFCAEVPEAFGLRLRALLPRLLSQCSACAEHLGLDGGGVGAAGESARGRGGELLPFLLPMLMQQVASPAGIAGAAEQAEWGEEQAEWLQLLRSDEVLPYLVAHSSHAAAAYMALLQQEGAMSAAADVEGAGAMLYNTVTLLLCTLRPGAVAGPVQGLPPLSPAALSCTLPLLGLLLAIVEGLLRPHNPLSNLKLLGGWAALCAELAAALLAQPSMTQQGSMPAAPLPEGEQQRVAAAALSTLRQTAEAVQAMAPHAGGSGLWESDADSGGGSAMLRDLMQNLDALAAAALCLLRVSPTFAAACGGDAWLGAVLGEGGLAVAVAAWEAGEGELSEWHHFLQAVQAAH